MSDRLPQLRPKECIRALERLGFAVRRQTGSHIILRHPTKKHIISVPHHPRDLHRSLLFSIIKQSGATQEEFLRALRS